MKKGVLLGLLALVAVAYSFKRNENTALPKEDTKERLLTQVKTLKTYMVSHPQYNAIARSIVLHHYDAVPYSEQSQPIVNSLGCPMINKTYFERIEKQIDKSKKEILLTIYY